MRKYLFGDIRVGPRAKQLLQKAVDAHWVAGGENVKLFEETFRKTFGYTEAVTTSSGTTADFTALGALHDYGATWGDEVIVPALCFVASANTILAAGFKPVFVDVRRDTLNLDPSKIEAKITPKTRAIMVVHTMGKPCDMDPILEIARRRKLKVIEDSCEAHGARYKGKVVGSMGDAGTFSFYAAHIICSGEGGMVVTGSPEFAKILRSVRSHGRPDGTIYFQFDRFGFNCKMNDLEAAVGVEGIENFETIFHGRKKNLNYLLEGTKDLDHVFYRLTEEKHELVSPHAFPLTFREGVKNDFIHFSKYLEEAGCQVKNLFRSLPTQHKVYGFLGHKLGEFPEAEYVGNKGIHVGCHQYLTKEDMDYFLELVHTYVKKHV